ncbi:MAG: biopolymer transporter ExbD [Dokdonella sp.]
MAFSSGSGGTGTPMSEINVTPMVDVMLVLLIIFMITAPLMSHKIRIDLPQANPNVQTETPPEPIDLAVKASGDIFWNDEPITEAMLVAQLRVAAQRTPQPELQIRADKVTEYQKIATVMADAKSAGMVKIGFITSGGESQQ